MLPDGELLRRYVEEGSQEAFATLVQRHINLVYRSALRRVGGDAHSADDVVQKVFTDLAKKALTLRDRPNLAGWLYTGTRFTAGQLVRTERRRRAQEQEAHTMQELDSPAEIPGQRLDPVLDEVMDSLTERDRDAVILHYFEGLPFHAVGESLSLSADAGRMRVNRALDRLRSELARRGIASTAGALSAALSTQSAFSAPAALSATVVQQALLAVPAVAKASLLARWLTAAKSGPGLATLGVTVAAGIVLVVNYSDRGSVPISQLANVTAVASPTSAPGAAPLMQTMAVESVALPSDGAGATPPAFSTAASVAGGGAFAQLSLEEKTLLKQLWADERYYGFTPGRAVAFRVGEAAPRFGEFANGRALLESRGLVNVGPNGGVFLNARGRAFAQANQAEIEVHPSLFKEPAGAIAVSPRTAFTSLTTEEKTLLKKLWMIELTTTQEPGKRAGILLAPTDPGYAAFIAGRDLLVAKGWVVVGAQRGVVFLRPVGKDFCAAHEVEIALHPQKDFASAVE